MGFKQVLLLLARVERELIVKKRYSTHISVLELEPRYQMELSVMLKRHGTTYIDYCTLNPQHV